MKEGLLVGRIVRRCGLNLWHPDWHCKTGDVRLTKLEQQAAQENALTLVGR